ncbi:hypothetical protein E3E38_03360 [Thermococcus sp. 18S1]|uniref:hypothetical protein n=1 Tax=Thermococcus sp. 18S1 TaxID=1638210 RepID=UPI00143C49C7|nr:hypothetical protein [Thermococcus sp. 18S1]NJE30088.1 hypothetical protein [Thermococcus sp. 18S1]
MRKLAVLILTVLLITPLFSMASAADDPQPLFNLDFVIKTAPTTINGSQVWMATFKVHAVLKDPAYRAYFENLAANNSTKAEEEFRDFVRQLVYENLKDNFEKRFEAANVSSTIYLPEGGPVRVLDNWSATVTFVISNFLVSDDGKVLRCPLSGSMDFVFKGHVFAYTWDKMTLILPEDYEVKNLAPKPDDFTDGVAIWTGGDYIPLIEVYTPLHTFMRFLNETHRTISLVYDPHEGYVQFNATFSGAEASKSTVEYIIKGFRGTMDIVSIDSSQRNNSLVVIGVAKPEVSYRETSKEKVWQAIIKLPGSFDEVHVEGGTYQLAPDNTVIITVTEEKTNYVPYLWGGLVVLVVLGIVVLKRRRSAGSEVEEAEEPPEEGEVSVEDSGNGGESGEMDGGE